MAAVAGVPTAAGVALDFDIAPVVDTAKCGLREIGHRDLVVSEEAFGVEVSVGGS
jgi:hypothetical protein